ncbi:CopG family transcriptional regulator [Microbispora bryophytorum]|uniref:CopG family transcriptional regulator n=1 Tax=Microbispora bryophytorum TaxID=1460882 RepID=UPI0033CA756E
MAMTLRLTDEQTEALRRRAEREGRSMRQIALDAIDDYLTRVADDEYTDILAEKGAQRFADLLRRLGE